MLASLVERNSGLTALGLNGNRLGPLAGAALADALQQGYAPIRLGLGLGLARVRVRVSPG